MSFTDLENEIYMKLKQNKKELKVEKIHEIDPEIITKYNSINVFLGKAGNGKSFNIYQTFAKISLVSPNTHLIIYISKTGRPNDKTFDLFEEFIKIPILFCSINDAVPLCDEIFQWKEIYRKMKEGEIDEDDIDIDEMCRVLQIKNVKQPWLHTIVYFEDSHQNPLIYGNNKTLYFLQRIPLFRHDQTSYYFAIQLLKGFPTDIKTQITDLFLFPGYSVQQLKFILNNINLKEDRDSFIESYKELKKKEFVNINNETGNIDFY